MSGGSAEEEKPEDRQCRHCGLWYEFAGLHPHEEHCDYRKVDRRVLELSDPYAISRVQAAEQSVEESVEGSLGHS